MPFDINFLSSITVKFDESIIDDLRGSRGIKFAISSTYARARTLANVERDAFQTTRQTLRLTAMVTKKQTIGNARVPDGILLGA